MSHPAFLPVFSFFFDARQNKMDEMLQCMSLHCGQDEYQTLLHAVRTLEGDLADITEREFAEIVALADRYATKIGDLVTRQRAELRAVRALVLAGDDCSAREMARVALTRLLRTVDEQGTK